MSRPIDKNRHPTVKPLKLMRYLVRLVTPPGGVVLDPFAGSGTTLIAAKEEGFGYIGIELEPEYIEIAEARLAAAERPPATLEAMLKGADIPPVEFESMSKVRHETAIDKIPDAIDHIKALMEEHQKLVVMCHHRDVLEAIAKGVEEFGVVRLQGGDSEASKQDAVDRFQNDPSVRIFIGSIRAAGVGITLTAASLLLFVELDWVPGIMTQAEDRIHRIGTAGSVLIQHLVYADSIDARIAEAIVEKQAIIEQALD